MRNFVQPGDVLTCIAPVGGVVSGLGYKIGQTFVVAAGNAVAAAEFEGQLSGVFDLVKLAGTAWTQGALVYWDNTAKKCTLVSTSNLLIGSAAKVGGEASAAVIGRVRLNGIARADGA